MAKHFPRLPQFRLATLFIVIGTSAILLMVNTRPQLGPNDDFSGGVYYDEKSGWSNYRPFATYQFGWPWIYRSDVEMDGKSIAPSDFFQIHWLPLFGNAALGFAIITTVAVTAEYWLRKRKQTRSPAGRL